MELTEEQIGWAQSALENISESGTPSGKVLDVIKNSRGLYFAIDLLVEEKLVIIHKHRGFPDRYMLTAKGIVVKGKPRQFISYWEQKQEEKKENVQAAKNAESMEALIAELKLEVTHLREFEARIETRVTDLEKQLRLLLNNIK